MTDCLIRNPNGFSFGYTPLTKIKERQDTQMNFGVLKLEKGQGYSLTSPLETACLLLEGWVQFRFSNRQATGERANYFRDDPVALHICAHEEANLLALSDCEMIMLQTHNEKVFPACLLSCDNWAESEHRGQGLLDDTAHRLVRTIFDTRNRPLSNLVLGEVLTFPGRWSSYPPHYHLQPEIYHYRFSEPQGYGHGELGDEVYKIRHNDTLKILNEKEHAQTSAPGYAMMYVWAIRHLPERPYTVPTFRPEHEWTKNKGANDRVFQLQKN